MEMVFGNQFAMAIIGGALIGLATGLLYLLNGRILGISGIAFGAVRSINSWQFVFLIGLLVSGLLANAFGLLKIESIPNDFGILIVSGLLVGIGAKIANGCTSGHGIAGISRFSIRSIIAVGTFMAAAIVTVLIKNLVA